MDYLAWNIKIYNYFFCHNINDKKIVIAANSRILKILAPEILNPEEDFITAIKEGPTNSNIYRYNFTPGTIGWTLKRTLNIIEKAFWLMTCCNERKYFDYIGSSRRDLIWPYKYPPYIAYLFFLILNVEDDENSYWHSLNCKLGLNGSLGSADGKYILCLFEDLKKRHKNFSFCNIYNSGAKKYVGTLYSQLPFTEKEEEIIVTSLKFLNISLDDIKLWDEDEKVSSLFEISPRLNHETFEILNDENSILREIIIDYYLKNIQNFDWTQEVKREEFESKIQKEEIPLKLFLQFNADEGFWLSLRFQTKSFLTTIGQSYSNCKIGDQSIYLGSSYSKDVYSYKNNEKLSKKNFSLSYSDIDGETRNKTLLFHPPEYVIFEYFQNGEYVQLGNNKSLISNKTYFFLFKENNEYESFINKLKIKKYPIPDLNGYKLIEFQNPGMGILNNHLLPAIKMETVGDWGIDYLMDGRNTFLSTGLPVLRLVNIVPNDILRIEYGNGIQANQHILNPFNEEYFDFRVHKKKLLKDRKVILSINRAGNELYSEIKNTKVPVVPCETLKGAMPDDFTSPLYDVHVLNASIKMLKFSDDIYFTTCEELLYTISNYKRIDFEKLKKTMLFFSFPEVEQSNAYELANMLEMMNYIRIEKSSNTKFAIPNPPHLVPLNIKDGTIPYFFLSGARDREFLFDFISWLKENNMKEGINYGYIDHFNKLLPTSIIIKPGNNLAFFALLERSKFKYLMKYKYLSDLSKANSSYIPYNHYIKLRKISDVESNLGCISSEMKYSVFDPISFRIINKLIYNTTEIHLGFKGSFDKKYFVCHNNQMAMFENREWAMYKYLSLVKRDDIVIYDSKNEILVVSCFFEFPPEYRRFLVLASGSVPKKIRVKNKFITKLNDKPTIFINTENISILNNSIAQYYLYRFVSLEMKELIKKNLEIEIRELGLSNLLN